MTSGSSREVLATWDPGYVDHVTVTMPPTWRSPDPSTYAFVLAEGALDSSSYEAFYRLVPSLDLSRPRLISTPTLELASLFHPLFYSRIVGTQRDPDIADSRLGAYLAGARGGRLSVRPSSPLPVASVRYWLQSMLFLAGVTLSAAVVQGRWSLGTLESKLDRLWQAGAVARARGPSDVAELDLLHRVGVLATQLQAPGTKVILELKETFAEVLRAVGSRITARSEWIRRTTLLHPQRARFGFVQDLSELLGPNLICIVAYGSSVTSATFADYDLILVVKRANEALERLANKRPLYRGKELNMAVFDEAECWSYQLVSGDNLSDHGLVLLGELVVPEKTLDDLLIRNYSFGFVRLRQLLGMAAHAATDGLATEADDKRNLYGYFEKIPLNVAKGIRGALGEEISKDKVAEWMRLSVGYEVIGERTAGALARAAWATQATLEVANEQHRVFETLPWQQAQVWAELEPLHSAADALAGAFE